MSQVSISNVTHSLESGSRPKGGVSTEGGDIPSIGGEHIGTDGGFRLDALKRVSREFFQSMRTGHIKPCDILVVKDGATTGRTSYVSNDFPFQEAAVNEHVFCLRINPTKAHAKFVFHFLRSPMGQAAVMSDFRGATVGGISRDFINKCKLVLPALPEQRRVADILDLADALKARRRAGLLQLDSLAQAIFVEMFGDPVTNPRRWPVLALDQVAEKITDGTHKTPQYTPQGVEFLSAKDIKKGRIQWGTEKFISIEEHRQLIKRCNPELGDLVLAKSGSLGAVAILDRGHDFSLFESLCLIKHDRTKVHGAFLHSVLRNPSMQARLLERNKGVGVKHLHLVDIRALELPIPPISLQRSFAGRIAAVESLREKQERAIDKTNALATVLQGRAFRGEL